MYRPKILIMDEPTAGLDPLLQNEVYEILKEMKSKGSTVFFSSHIISEIVRIADRVGIIKEGRLADGETIDEIRGHRRKSKSILWMLTEKKIFQKLKILKFWRQGKIIYVFLQKVLLQNI